MSRRRVSSEVREKVYSKYNGRCAYCGSKVHYKDMQIDHVFPLSLGGADTEDNYLPSCSACNFRKGKLTLEKFRKSLSRLKRKMYSRHLDYRLAIKYNLISENDIPIKFYFEEVNDDGIENQYS